MQAPASGAAPSGGPAKGRSLAGKLLGLQVALVAGFVALELGLRFIEQHTRGRPFFAQDTFESPWFPTRDWPPPRIDSDGRAFFRHRTEPVATEKSPGVVRVIAVGGSTTANKRAFAMGGVDFALALERRLNARGDGRRYEVLNAGAESFSTAHILVNLLLRVFEFRPDVVLCMENINDLSASYYGERVEADYANKYLDAEFLDPALESGRSLHGFLMRSRVLRNVSWLRRWNKTRAHPAEDVSAGLGYFRRNLDEIARACREHGARLVLLTQPNDGVDDPSYSQAQFARFNQEIEAAARANGAEFLDMHALFGHDRARFVDAVHYTPEGCEAFAEILAREIVFAR